MNKCLTNLQEAYKSIYINESINYSSEVEPFTTPNYLNNPKAKSYVEHLANGIIAHAKDAKHIFNNAIGLYTNADVRRDPNNLSYVFTRNFLDFLENGDYSEKEELLKIIQPSINHYKKHV
jgi:hypothetical protein